VKEEEEKKGGKFKGGRKKSKKKIKGKEKRRKLDLFVFFLPLKQMCHYLLLFLKNYKTLVHLLSIFLYFFC
jgi:hypothetical protein